MFSSNFDSLLRKISRLLWHVVGHLYVAHWEQLYATGLRPQASAVAGHFLALCSQFALLDAKELACLAEILRRCRPPPPSVESEGDVEKVEKEDGNEEANRMDIDDSSGSVSGSGEFQGKDNVDLAGKFGFESSSQTGASPRLQQNNSGNWSGSGPGSFGQACAQTA